MAKKTCGKKNVLIDAPDPKDSIVLVCALPPHKDDGHMDENGSVWTQAGDELADSMIEHIVVE